jgi:cytidylate kinase
LTAQELVGQVAQEAHVRRQVIQSLDERTQDAIDEWIGAQFGGGRFSRSEYLHNLSKVVLTLGRHGQGILIGRGAHFILDPERTLRVRAVAPIAMRVARIAERSGAPHAEAQAEVERIDAERAAFCRQYFDRDLSDARHYDLVVNTGTLSELACADLVVRAFGARFKNETAST